ncbi:hypothetical protein MHYP_G00064820 [Metynnis hypsauchen]
MNKPLDVTNREVFRNSKYHKPGFPQCLKVMDFKMSLGKGDYKFLSFKSISQPSSTEEKNNFVSKIFQLCTVTYFNI